MSETKGEHKDDQDDMGLALMFDLSAINPKDKILNDEGLSLMLPPLKGIILQYSLLISDILDDMDVIDLPSVLWLQACELRLFSSEKSKQSFLQNKKLPSNDDQKLINLSFTRGTEELITWLHNNKYYTLNKKYDNCIGKILNCCRTNNLPFMKILMNYVHKEDLLRAREIILTEICVYSDNTEMFIFALSQVHNPNTEPKAALLTKIFGLIPERNYKFKIWLLLRYIMTKITNEKSAATVIDNKVVYRQHKINTKTYEELKNTVIFTNEKNVYWFNHINNAICRRWITDDVKDSKEEKTDYEEDVYDTKYYKENKTLVKQPDFINQRIAWHKAFVKSVISNNDVLFKWIHNKYHISRMIGLIAFLAAAELNSCKKMVSLRDMFSINIDMIKGKDSYISSHMKEWIKTNIKV